MPCWRAARRRARSCWKASEMPIRRLDHVNVVTTSLEKMVAWYGAVLGLRLEPRPDFPFGGGWLSAGLAAVVHLVEETGQARAGSEPALKLDILRSRRRTPRPSRGPCWTRGRGSKGSRSRALAASSSISPTRTGTTCMLTLI
ncbi:VOC family protein [Dinoroseobacter sp. S375]|uniref:VOC family protein n=1 Tax=Dinoroseobacter sp. S375 TaxID=3415136 RepID=UPI003C7EB660